MTCWHAYTARAVVCAAALAGVLVAASAARAADGSFTFSNGVPGDPGIVRLSFANSQLRAGAGIGTVAAQPGSTLARWMGASRVVGATTLIVADITAKVEPCGPTLAGCP